MSNSDGGSKLSGALIDNGGAEILVASGAEVWGTRDAEGAHTAVLAVSTSAHQSKDFMKYLPSRSSFCLRANPGLSTPVLRLPGSI